eukprot:652899-Alexandrium_andersonii.AAC.1
MEPPLQFSIQRNCIFVRQASSSSSQVPATPAVPTAEVPVQVAAAEVPKTEVPVPGAEVPKAEVPVPAAEVPSVPVPAAE